MRALIVYESLYGNTRSVADTIGEALRGPFDVLVVPVSEASPDAVAEADLLVVGGPTYVHGMSSAHSRQAAVKAAPGQAAAAGTGVPLGIREWLQQLPQGHGVAAAFDTRIAKPRLLTGAASGKVARRLKRVGRTVVGTESFLVEDTSGPLRAGELDRARQWAESLSQHATAAAA